MSSNSEWEMLCEEYIKANDSERATWLIIQAKYHAIANGASTANPTDQELDAYLQARRVLASVREQMDVFMKKFLDGR